MIVGGIFANGAVTGAFVYVIVEAGRRKQEQISNEISGSAFTGEEILMAGDGAISTTCGPGTVSCVANSAAGYGGYDADGRKNALYSCRNSGGHCQFVAPSNGENVFGAVLGTTYNPNGGGVAVNAYGLEQFTVNPNNFYHRYFRYNRDFIDALRQVQRNE